MKLKIFNVRQTINHLNHRLLVDVVANENLVLIHLDELQVHQNLVLNHLGELQVHQIVAHPNHLVAVEDENEVQLNLVHPNQLDVIEDEKILVNHPGRLDENVNQSPNVSRCPKRNRKSVFILIMKNTLQMKNYLTNVYCKIDCEFTFTAF